MWSFATHAGAGMAIAGLTATYYALSRRNEQGERERMEHESGFGDGPQVNKLRKRNESADNSGHLSSSHMLLKKELEELSGLHGSGSGLNIIYQQKTPLHKLNRSNFEITPIVSRVDTRPSTVFSPSDEDIGTTESSAAAAEDSVFGSDPKLDDTGIASVNKDIGYEELLDVLAEEENKFLEMGGDMDENGNGELNDDMIEDSLTQEDSQQSIIDTSAVEVESISSYEVQQSESVIQKWKAVQENQFLKRTTSPICFFKNPGFGNRYAVTIPKKKEPKPLVATLSSSNPNVASTSVTGGNSRKSSKNVKLSPSDTCQNSTQFILSPDLSKSNVSVCEAENPEKLLKKRKKKLPTTCAKTIVDTNPVEEMSEYNKALRKKSTASNDGGNVKGEGGAQSGIWLRADPENKKVHFPLKRIAKPVMLPAPSESKENDDDSYNQKGESEEIGKMGDPEKDFEGDEETKDCGNNNDNDTVENSKTECEEWIGVSEEPLVVPSMRDDCRVVGSVSSRSPSSLVTDIPNNSWIALPVRIYTNSMRTLPWPLIGFCVLVVIIAGFLGIFLSKLADSVSRRHIP